MGGSHINIIAVEQRSIHQVAGIIYKDHLASSRLFPLAGLQFKVFQARGHFPGFHNLVCEFPCLVCLYFFKGFDPGLFLGEIILHNL